MQHNGLVVESTKVYVQNFREVVLVYFSTPLHYI